MVHTDPEHQKHAQLVTCMVSMQTVHKHGCFQLSGSVFRLFQDELSLDVSTERQKFGFTIWLYKPTSCLGWLCRSPMYFMCIKSPKLFDSTCNKWEQKQYHSYYFCDIYFCPSSAYGNIQVPSRLCRSCDQCCFYCSECILVQWHQYSLWNINVICTWELWILSGAALHLDCTEATVMMFSAVFTVCTLLWGNTVKL